MLLLSKWGNQRTYVSAFLQVVELRHLVEAVDRTRYGVNGSSGLLPASWRKRFNEWMVDALSNSRQMRTLPTSL